MGQQFTKLDAAENIFFARQLEYMKLQGMGNNQYDLITV